LLRWRRLLQERRGRRVRAAPLGIIVRLAGASGLILTGGGCLVGSLLIALVRQRV